LLAADGGAGQQWLAERRPYLKGLSPQKGPATALVCENQTCRTPVAAPSELELLLASD
jgi:uncharacterized protein YyaL (SSP411 family)